MSNGRELMAAQAAREQALGSDGIAITHEQRRVMVVDDGQQGRSLAALMGLLGGMGFSSAVEDYLPEMRAGNKYEPHQGKKERERNLRRLQTAAARRK